MNKGMLLVLGLAGGLVRAEPAAVPMAPKGCLPEKDGLDRSCARDVEVDDACNKFAPAKGLLGFHEESCLIGPGKPLIPEIFSLNQNTPVPKDVYKKYKEADIARNLIHRYHQKFERPSMTREDVLHPAYDFYKNTEVIMAFDDYVLPAILAGGFKNQFQTHRTNGSYNPENRNIAEKNMIRVPLSSSAALGDKLPVNIVRPKYAFLTFKSRKQELLPGFDVRYGNMMAVFKPKVKLRATFTNDDSLALYDEPSAVNVITAAHTESKVTFDGCSGYCETQMWGPLSFDDVEYVLVNCPEFDPVEPSSIKALTAARPNMAVYSCDGVYDGDILVRLVPKKLLHGKPIPNAPFKINLKIDSATRWQDEIGKACTKGDWCHVWVDSHTADGPADFRWSCVSGGVVKSTQVLHVPTTEARLRLRFDCSAKTPLASWKKVPAIRVIEATLGANVPGVQAGNVTDKVAKFCNGRETCEYKLSPRYIEDPAPNKPKEFVVRWRCTSDPAEVEKKLTLSEDAMGKLADLKCPPMADGDSEEITNAH